MKKYFVFAGDGHYPLSGLHDLKNISDELEVAQTIAKSLESEEDWVEIWECDIKNNAWKMAYPYRE